MGKRFLLILLLVAICLIAVGCTGRTNQNEEPDEEMIIKIEEMQRRLRYLEEMWFFNIMGIDNDIRLNITGHMEVIFVHNEDEARALFPDRCWEGYDHNNPPDVFVAWPDPERSQGVINGLNYYALLPAHRVHRTDFVDLEKFSLSYPITLEDLVDNWEKVYELWMSLSFVRRGGIVGDARLHGSAAFLRDLEQIREEIAALAYCSLTGEGERPQITQIVSVHDGMAVVMSAREWALIEIMSEEEIIPFGEFDEIIVGYGNMAAVSLDGQWSIIDITNRETIFSHIRSDERIVGIHSNGLVTVRRITRMHAGSDSAVFDIASGKEVIPFGTYSAIRVYAEAGLAVVDWGLQSRDVFGIIDLATGETIIPLLQYESIGPIVDDMVLVRTRWRQSEELIDIGSGETVIASGEYRSIQLRQNGLAVVETHREALSFRGLIDVASGEEVILIGKYDDIGCVYGGLAVVRIGNSRGLIDIASGEEVIPIGRYDDIELHSGGFIALRINNGWEIACVEEVKLSYGWDTTYGEPTNENLTGDAALILELGELREYAFEGEVRIRIGMQFRHSLPLTEHETLYRAYPSRFTVSGTTSYEHRQTWVKYAEASRGQIPLFQTERLFEQDAVYINLKTSITESAIGDIRYVRLTNDEVGRITGHPLTTDLRGLPPGQGTVADVLGTVFDLLTQFAATYNQYPPIAVLSNVLFEQLQAMDRAENISQQIFVSEAGKRIRQDILVEIPGIITVESTFFFTPQTVEQAETPDQIMDFSQFMQILDATLPIALASPERQAAFAEKIAVEYTLTGITLINHFLSQNSAFETETIVGYFGDYHRVLRPRGSIGDPPGVITHDGIRLSFASHPPQHPLLAFDAVVLVDEWVRGQRVSESRLNYPPYRRRDLQLLGPIQTIPDRSMAVVPFRRVAPLEDETITQFFFAQILPSGEIIRGTLWVWTTRADLMSPSRYAAMVELGQLIGVNFIDFFD